MVEAIKDGYGSGSLASPVFTGGVQSSSTKPLGGNASKGPTIVQETGDGDISIRPNFRERFRAQQAQAIIHSVLQEQLKGQTYSTDAAAQWVKAISDDIKQKLKNLNLPRYKFVVSVYLGEMRGEGVQLKHIGSVGTRCFWDRDTDQVAQDTFLNDSIFCNAVAYGVYFY